jgi:hypothetical protein
MRCIFPLSALTALAIFTITVLELTGDKWLMGTFTVAFFGLLVGWRGVAVISSRRFRRTVAAFLGVLSCVMARSMIVSPVQSTASRKARASEFI